MRKVRIAFAGLMVGAILVGLMPFRLVTVLTDSMSPELEVGDVVVVKKTRNPNKGSVVAFYKDFEDDDGVYTTFLTKRVAGVEGDRVVSDGSTVSCNGEIIAECVTVFDYVIPPGQLFVVGDNQHSSVDSRQWNDPFVSEATVVGNVVGAVSKGTLNFRIVK